jgi:hypothetical protein
MVALLDRENCDVAAGAPSTRHGMVLGPLSTLHPREPLGWVETAWNLPIQMPLTTAALEA